MSRLVGVRGMIRGSIESTARSMESTALEDGNVPANVRESPARPRCQFVRPTADHPVSAFAPSTLRSQSTYCSREESTGRRFWTARRYLSVGIGAGGVFEPEHPVSVGAS